MTKARDIITKPKFGNTTLSNFSQYTTSVNLFTDIDLLSKLGNPEKFTNILNLLVNVLVKIAFSLMI